MVLAVSQNVGRGQRFGPFLLASSLKTGHSRQFGQKLRRWRRLARWRWPGRDGVRLVGNAAGRSRTGSYGGAGCGEQPAKVLLAGGLSPATKDARSEPGMTGKRRAVKWLCINDILETNRRNRPICFQEVAEYQQDRCPAKAAACGGLADGECRYRDAVFSGGTDLPFPRRGGKWPRRERNWEGRGYKKKQKGSV